MSHLGVFCTETRREYGSIVTSLLHLQEHATYPDLSQINPLHTPVSHTEDRFQ